MSDALIVGAPSVLASWAHALAREAANLRNPPLEIRTLDRLDDAEFLGSADSGPDRLFLSSFPSTSLIGKVAARAVPTLAVMDEPIDSVRYMKLQSKWPMIEVLRAQTLSHSIDRALYRNDSVFILHRGADMQPAELIDVVLDCLGIKLDKQTVDGLKARHTQQGAATTLEEMLKRNVPEWAPIDELASSLPKDEAELVAQILTPLVHFAFDERPPRIIWPQKVFVFGDKPDEPPPVVTDVTGGARTMFYGPYFYLPPERFRVSFVIGYSDETRGMPFMFLAVQQLGQSVIARARWTSPGGGIFEGNFELAIALSNEPVEIVFRSDEGAIEGKVAMVQVGFDLLGEDDAPVSPALLSPVRR